MLRVGQKILALDGVVLGDKEDGRSFDDVLKKKEKGESAAKSEHEIVVVNLLPGDTLMGSLVMQGIGEGVDKLAAMKFDGISGELVQTDPNDTHADNPKMSNHLFQFAIFNRNVPFLKAMVKVLGSRAIPALSYGKQDVVASTGVDKLQEALRLMRTAMLGHCPAAMEPIAELFPVSALCFPASVKDLNEYENYNSIANVGEKEEMQQLLGQSAKTRYLNVEFESVLMMLDMCVKDRCVEGARWCIGVAKLLLDTYADDDAECVDLCVPAIIAAYQLKLPTDVEKSTTSMPLLVVAARFYCNALKELRSAPETQSASSSTMLSIEDDGYGFDLASYALANEHHARRIAAAKVAQGEEKFCIKLGDTPDATLELSAETSQ